MESSADLRESEWGKSKMAAAAVRYRAVQPDRARTASGNLFRLNHWSDANAAKASVHWSRGLPPNATILFSRFLPTCGVWCGNALMLVRETLAAIISRFLLSSKVEIQGFKPGGMDLRYINTCEPSLAVSPSWDLVSYKKMCCLAS